MKRARLDSALEELEREGVLDAEQRGRVREKLAHALFPKADPVARFVSLIGGMGGVLIGMGVLYLVALNWQAMGKPVQLCLIFATLVGLHGAGYWLSEGSQRAPAVGRALTAAGVLAFGGALFLVAQIYHLQSDYPYALLAWWALSVPFVLFTGSTVILYIVMAIALAWSFWHTGVWVEDAMTRSADEAAAIGLFTVGLAALWVALAGLARRSRWSAFAPHLGRVGVVVAVAAPYMLSFKHMWYDEDWRVPFLSYVPFFVTALAASLVAAFASRGDARGGVLRDTGTVLGLGALLAVSVAIYPPATFLVANVVLLLGVVALIAHGLRRERIQYINLGVSVFTLTAVTRYFEYLWDKIEGAGAFLVTGFLLLGLVALVERSRRSWTRTIAREAHS